MLAVFAIDEPNRWSKSGRSTRICSTETKRRYSLESDYETAKRASSLRRDGTNERRTPLRFFRFRNYVYYGAYKMPRLIKSNEYTKIVSPLFRTLFTLANRASIVKSLRTRGKAIRRGKNRRESRDNERNTGDDRDEDDKSPLVSDRPFVSRLTRSCRDARFRQKTRAVALRKRARIADDSCQINVKKKALAERNFEWDASKEGCPATPVKCPSPRGKTVCAIFPALKLACARGR